MDDTKTQNPVPNSTPLPSMPLETPMVPVPESPKEAEPVAPVPPPIVPEVPQSVPPVPQDPPIDKSTNPVYPGVSTPTPESVVQSTLPPITSAKTFGGAKFLIAGAGAVVIILIAATVVLTTQQSLKQSTETNTSAKTLYNTPPPQPSPTPTISPDTPDAVNKIDVGTGTEGVKDIQNDASGL